MTAHKHAEIADALLAQAGGIDMATTTTADTRGLATAPPIIVTLPAGWYPVADWELALWAAERLEEGE